MATTKTSCASRIKDALSMRGMRQVELCEMTKIPKSAMSQYVSGAFEPKQDRIYLIAKALNVSEAWLMGYDVPMSRVNTNVTPTEATENDSTPEISENRRKLIDFAHSVPEEKVEQVYSIIQSILEALK
jgi:transcriptional regulator with XRE-family HTH domain